MFSLVNTITERILFTLRTYTLPLILVIYVLTFKKKKMFYNSDKRLSVKIFVFSFRHTVFTRKWVDITKCNTPPVAGKKNKKTIHTNRSLVQYIYLYIYQHRVERFARTKDTIIKFLTFVTQRVRLKVFFCQETSYSELNNIYNCKITF